MRYVLELATGKTLSYRCVYPIDPYPITTTFDRVTGAQSWFYQTSLAGNASVYNAPGRLADTLPYKSAGFTMSNPERPTSVSSSWNAQTLSNNGKPVYGYYRLEWKTDYITVQKTSWPAWTGNSTVEYKQIRTYYRTSATPYTYAC